MAAADEDATSKDAGTDEAATADEAASGAGAGLGAGAGVGAGATTMVNLAQDYLINQVVTKKNVKITGNNTSKCTLVKFMTSSP
jgi:hypothetical protein